MLDSPVKIIALAGVLLAISLLVTQRIVYRDHDRIDELERKLRGLAA